MSAVVEESAALRDADPPVPALRDAIRSPLVRWLPALVTVTVTIVFLLIADASPADITRYALYALWGLVLPGTLVYRALRRVPHSLVDDLAMGTAVGFALELAGWALYAAAGLQGYLWTWPAFVVLPFLAVPALRRHWRTPEGYRRPSLGWSWTVAAMVLTFMTYLAVTLLRGTPIPITEAHWYYLDNTYLLSLVADAKHHFPIGTPQVAGEPLDYHWFTFAHMASGSLISGVSAPVVYFQFALPLICGVSTVLMAVAGWRVSGRAWVGAGAAALMFMVGEFTASDYVMFGLIGRWMVTNSPSMAYAWLSTIPLVMIGVDRIRRVGLPDAPLGRGAWILLALFAAAAAGAKSTILFVLLAGLGTVALYQVVRRRLRWGTVAAVAIVVGVVGVSFAALYGGGSGGVRWAPFQVLKFYIPMASRSFGDKLGVFAFMGGAYAIYMLARLLGVPILAWLAFRRRRDAEGPLWSSREWFLFGAISAGTVGTLLLGHITSAQIYLLRSAWPFGVILSAMGLAALIDRYRLPARVVTMIVTGAVVIAVGVVLTLNATTLATAGMGLRFVAPVYWAAAVTVSVCVVGCVGWWLFRRRRGWAPGVGVVASAVLVLGMGLPVFLGEIKHYLITETTETTFYTELVTPDGIAMTNWLKLNTSANEILATNGHCSAGSPAGQCRNQRSWLSAYAERRVLVEGWGYSGKSVAEAVAVGTWIGTRPFFDPAKLAANDAAFSAPTRDGLMELRDRYGVRWLIVDRTAGRESPELGRFAQLRFERGDHAVYQMP